MGKRRNSNTPSAAVDGQAVCSLNVVSRPIADLTVNPQNPRLHTKKQIRQIADSIRAFGFNVPVLIDGQAQIVAGHGRVQACQELGIRVVPTISLSHLTTMQAKAFVLADNKLTENSSWDERLLGEQLKELAAVNLDFSLEATGFEMGEIDVCIQGVAPTPLNEEDPVNEVPEPTSGAPVSQAKDLWVLGPHRVFVGSALEETAYAALMGEQQAAMVFTDPPYNVPIEGHASGLGRLRHKDFVMASGEMTVTEFTEFLLKTCLLLRRYTRDGSLHFICMDWRHAENLLAAGRSAYAELKNICVWDKGVGGMGSLYRSGHELVFVYKQGKGRHRNNVQLGQFGRNRTNVWRYPGSHACARSTDEGNLLAIHPTVKPVALVADVILDASARHDLVLDPFLGSGTSIIAAERTGRICYGMELDPRYVDVTIRRWQAYTGDYARHAVTGRRFGEVAKKKHGGTRHATR
jgi:DNA modification methylase